MFFKNKWGFTVLILCETIGGLNDRLKFLVSCMRVDDELKLIWSVKENSIHLWCSFKDLFTNDFEEFNDRYEADKKYSEADFTRCVSGSQFKQVFPNDINLNNMGIDNWYELIPEEQKKSILDQINKLKPVPYIKNTVDEFKSKFSDDVTTVSIRSFNDAARNIKANGRHFDINKIFKTMDDKMFHDKLFFVTCDNQDTFQEVLDRYGDRIIYTPKRTYFGDYRTLEGIQDCVIDLLLGGHNKNMISTNGSGFCDMQWWFGGGKSKIKTVYAHKHL